MYVSLSERVQLPQSLFEILNVFICNFDLQLHLLFLFYLLFVLRMGPESSVLILNLYDSLAGREVLLVLYRSA